MIQITKVQNYAFLIAVLIIQDCSAEVKLADLQATALTSQLYQNLKSLSEERTLFGHQDSLAYGVNWVGDPDRSDVKDVTGSFPALYGWDLLELERAADDPGEYSMTSANYVMWTKEVFQRGGVTTFSWHLSNPVSKKGFYDKTPAVHTILPGGENHTWFKNRLDDVASLFLNLEDIPVIFRPWHEHNGDWFWWGKAFCSEEDYISLWKFTVEYLRDEKEVHNAIYAFAPDRSRLPSGESMVSEYLYGYPGDEYVDIIGIDNYWDLGKQGNKKSPQQQHLDFIESLELIVRIADEKNKVAALTETGLEGIPNARWWTDILLRGILANETTRKIAYVHVWRNANRDAENRKTHFYAPYPGQESAEDFVAFKEHPAVLFEDELPELYYP